MKELCHPPGVGQLAGGRGLAGGHPLPAGLGPRLPRHAHHLRRQARGPVRAQPQQNPAQDIQTDIQVGDGGLSVK